MAGFLRKLGLLSWKNLKFIPRHPIAFAFELVMPILIFGIIAYIQSTLTHNSVETVTTPTYYKINSADDVIIEYFPRETVKLYYIPNNNFTNGLMENVRNMLVFSKKRLKSLSSEAELEELYSKSHINSTTTATRVMAVIFEGSIVSPKNLVYKIRTDNSAWKTSLLFPKHEASGPIDNSELYFHSGFLALQYAIETSFTNLIKPQTSIPVEFKVQEFPYPPYTPDVSSQSASAVILSFGVVYGIIPLFVNVLSAIMGDKTSGATELMKLMGMSRLLLWVSWFVRAIAVSIVIITAITCLLTLPMNEVSNPAFAESDISLIWVMLMLYFAAVIVFIFFISTLFSKAIFASIFSQIIWVASFAVGQNLIKSSSGFSIKLLASFFPNMAIYFGLSIIESFEARHVGAHWSNLCKLPEGGTIGMSLAHVLVMLIVDIGLFSFLTWYLDSVKPGTYGVPLPWDFCFSQGYWRSSRVDSSQPFNSLADLKNYEPATQNLAVGIKIQDLRKIYASGKVAVDGVTLDIYEDQITALLGHNGAGKTTTMSILTGMLASSSGNIWINDYNIRTDLSKVRESLGLCPQHDMLFPELTVMEHLVFFGMLKGCSKAEARTDALNLLEHLSLEEKAGAMGSKLSGGMKRKLSLGIALVGGSRVVMLDEPTSGLDPEARRKVWDLLLSMRGQRTILLTTHFMEEADVLGDRIAIMDHGRVQCYGSALYLKKLYGAGYILKLLTRDDHNENAIAQFVQRSLPGAKIKSRLGTELAFALPLEQKPLFPGLFHEIESNKAALGIVSIGVSLTTLEDVFLNVGKLAKEVDDEVDGKRDQTDNAELLQKGIYKRLKGISFRIQQLEGLLIKKFIYSCRHWGLLLVVATVAILTMASTISLSFNVLGEQASSEPPLALSLSRFGATEVLHTAARSVAQWYEGPVAAQGSVSRYVSLNEGLPAAILAVAANDMAHYREGLMVAADIRANASLIYVNAMYSGFSYHSAPISVNLLNNALLRGVMQSDQYSITVINHPFKQRENLQGAILQSFVVSAIWQTIVPFGLCFLLGFFLIFPLTERLNNGKQLQLMSGIRPLGYWLVCYFCDLLVYVLAVLGMVTMLYVWDVNGVFGGSTEAGVLTLILVLHGLSGIPYAYFFSYFSKTPLSGFSIFFTVNCMMVTLVPAVMSIFEVFLPYGQQSGYLGPIRKLLCLSPPYGLVLCLTDFVGRVVQNNRCPSMTEIARKQLCLESPADVCCGTPAEPAPAYLELESVSNPGAIGWPLLILAADVVVYLALILLIDHGLVDRAVEAAKRAWLARTRPGSDEDEVDADVRMEMDRVNDSEGDVLTVTALSKVFGRSHHAVRGLSFGVPPGDCFGLLGVNGAGKTTTFRMLTGDLQPTAGDASIDGFHLAMHKDQYLSQIGYCPQFDGFNESLTGRETLELFARLRGIPMDEIGKQVRRWLVVMGLEEYQDCLSGTYSGGNKRKLSTAMALIGEPALVFLDEPTSGVDPVARRNLWKVLAAAQTTDTAIVLTSHSMEECEALCNRLAIMVDGQFKCIGETQYLKQKFGQGFTVLIKLKTNEPDPSAVKTFKGAFVAMFAKSILKDEHQGWLHYHLTDPNTRWKDLFSNMEVLKMRYSTVEDYTVSETTLEQVFLSFAKRSNLS